MLRLQRQLEPWQRQACSLSQHVPVRPQFAHAKVQRCKRD